MTGLDVGCGSGALTIACAKRNPHAQMVGIDRWGKEYASFNLPLCERNAEAEGVRNVSFTRGNAVKLDFPDETFDAVTSNYVYHNIKGKDKQQLLSETLRILKKGGTFAIRKYNGSFIPATQNIAVWNANEELRSKTSAIIKNSQYLFIFKLAAPDMKDVLDVY